VIGVLPFVLGTPSADVNVGRLATIVIGSFTAMSAVSAAGSLALARRGEQRERLGSGSSQARIGDGE
jgi:hypothetical protein